MSVKGRCLNSGSQSAYHLSVFEFLEAHFQGHNQLIIQLEDRNNLEKLTLAALAHLPTVVLFVHDLTGECGTSPSYQYLIYQEIKERCSSHLWIDVVSKCDLLQESPALYVTEDAEADHSELIKYRKMGPDGALRVSVKCELGLNEVRRAGFKWLSSECGMKCIRYAYAVSSALHDVGTILHKDFMLQLVCRKPAKLMLLTSCHVLMFVCYHRFMAASDGIKERKVVHQVTSPLPGEIIVDDVDLIFRRLTFERSEGLIQSEGLLTSEGPQQTVSYKGNDKSGSSKSKKKGTQKIDYNVSLAADDASNDLSVDPGYLPSSYHSEIISGFMLISSYLDRMASSGRPATGTQIKMDTMLTENEELVVQCLQTNYYGAKRMIEHFLPLLELSDSPRIVNVSSSMGKLKLYNCLFKKGQKSNQDRQIWTSCWQINCLSRQFLLRYV